MKFELLKSSEVTAEDLKRHATWFTFYEPGEYELLAELGFDIELARSAISSTNNIDQYMVPLPEEGATLPFKYLYLSVVITTPSGKNLVGYKIGSSLLVLAETNKFNFNKNLSALSKEQETALANCIHEKSIFPMEIYVVALNKSETYSI